MATMAGEDTNSGVMRGERHFKFKGVRSKGLICEVKNARGKLYMTLPPGTKLQKGAVLVDLFLLSTDPDVDVSNLNLKMVVESLGSSLNIDKTFYQETIEGISLESLTKEKLWLKAQEVYDLLVDKVLWVEGRRKEDEADIYPAFEEGVIHQENLTCEGLLKVITSLEEKLKMKDAEYKEKDVECKEKDAVIECLKKELHAAHAMVDGQPLKRRAASVTSTGELPRGDASTSKVGEVEDAISASWHDLGLATPGDDIETVFPLNDRSFLDEPMNLYNVFG